MACHACAYFNIQLKSMPGGRLAEGHKRIRVRICGLSMGASLRTPPLYFGQHRQKRQEIGIALATSIGASENDRWD